MMWIWHKWEDTPNNPKMGWKGSRRITKLRRASCVSHIWHNANTILNLFPKLQLYNEVLIIEAFVSFTTNPNSNYIHFFPSFSLHSIFRSLKGWEETVIILFEKKLFLNGSHNCYTIISLTSVNFHTIIELWKSFYSIQWNDVRLDLRIASD